MQQAVDDEMDDMVVDRLVFQCGFPHNRLGGQHNVAQHGRQRTPLGERKSRERQDVGRFVLATPSRIETAYMGVVRKNDAELGTAGRTGFGKRGGNGAIDQPRQRGLIGPVARFDCYIDVDGNRKIPPTDFLSSAIRLHHRVFLFEHRIFAKPVPTFGSDAIFCLSIGFSQNRFPLLGPML
ncbi:hypothetical protein MesoLjLa_00410 [Mesorhizobium sp. L-2-11]|nr:hypothetical protein MesoLjLa_00410 [Mesorhizobium sp. L-2-11]